jgi:hypothetical protein
MSKAETLFCGVIAGWGIVSVCEGGEERERFRCSVVKIQNSTL